MVFKPHPLLTKPANFLGTSAGTIFYQYKSNPQTCYEQTQLPPFKGNYIYSNKAVARLFPHSEASFYCAAP